MPEVHNYIVTQTREVWVCANSLTDAVRIANAAFASGQNSDFGVKDSPNEVWGNTVSKVREVDILAKEEL